MENKTDMVAKYNQIAYQTKGFENPDQAWASGKWIQIFEELTFKYLDALFWKPSETDNMDPAQQKGMAGDFLAEISRIQSQQDEVHISALLPLMANLTFLRQKDYKLVSTGELSNMVNAFRRTTESTAYRSLGMNIQLNKIVDFVDNIRRFAEFLLKSAVPPVITPGPFFDDSTTSVRQNSKQELNVKEMEDINRRNLYQNRNDYQYQGCNYNDANNAGWNNQNLNNGGWNVNDLLQQLQYCLLRGNNQQISRQMCKNKQTENGCCSNNGRAVENDNSCPCSVALPRPRPTGRSGCGVPPPRIIRQRCSPCPKEPREPTDDEPWCPMTVQGVGIKENFPSVTYFPNIRELKIPGTKIFDCPPKCKFEPPLPPCIRPPQWQCHKTSHHTKKQPLACSWRDKCEAPRVKRTACQPKKQVNAQTGNDITVQDIMMTLCITPDNLEDLASFPNLTPEIVALLSEMLKAVGRSGVGNSRQEQPPPRPVDFVGKDAEMNTDLRKPREPFNVQVGTEVRNVPMSMNNKKTPGGNLSENDAQLLSLLLASKGAIMTALQSQSAKCQQLPEEIGTPSVRVQNFTKGIQTEDGKKWNIEGQIVTQNICTQASIHDLRLNEKNVDCWDYQKRTTTRPQDDNRCIRQTTNNEELSLIKQAQARERENPKPAGYSISLALLTRTLITKNPTTGGRGCEVTKKMSKSFSTSDLTNGELRSMKNTGCHQATATTHSMVGVGNNGVDCSTGPPRTGRGNYIASNSYFGNSCNPPTRDTILKKSEKSEIPKVRKSYSKIQSKTVNRSNESAMRLGESTTAIPPKEVSSESQPGPPNKQESTIIQEAWPQEQPGPPNRQESTIIQEAWPQQQTEETLGTDDKDEQSIEVEDEVIAVVPSMVDLQIISQDEKNEGDIPSTELDEVAVDELIDPEEKESIMIIDESSLNPSDPVEIAETPQFTQETVPLLEKISAIESQHVPKEQEILQQIPPPIPTQIKPPPHKKPRNPYKSPLKFNPQQPPMDSTMCALNQLESLPEWHPLRTAYPPQYRFDEKKLEKYMTQCMFNKIHNNGNTMQNGMSYASSGQNGCPIPYVTCPVPQTGYVPPSSNADPQTSQGSNGYPPPIATFGASAQQNGYPPQTGQFGVPPNGYLPQASPQNQNGYPPQSGCPPQAEPLAIPPPPQLPNLPQVSGTVPQNQNGFPPPPLAYGYPPQVEPFTIPPPPPLPNGYLPQASALGTTPQPIAYLPQSGPPTVQLGQLPPLPITPPPSAVYEDDNSCAFRNVVYPSMKNNGGGAAPFGQSCLIPGVPGQQQRPGICGHTSIKNQPPSPCKLMKPKKTKSIKYIPCNCQDEDDDDPIDPCITQ